MKKPREFWLLKNDVCDGYVVCLANPDYPSPHGIHVREVIEISEQEIRNSAFDYDIVNEHKDIEKAFEAGARWALAKLRGGE